MSEGNEVTDNQVMKLPCVIIFHNLTIRMGGNTGTNRCESERKIKLTEKMAISELLETRKVAGLPGQRGAWRINMMAVDEVITSHWHLQHNSGQGVGDVV